MSLSVGELIDKLSIVNNKIFYLVDVVKYASNDRVVAEAARKAQALNDERSRLINEINRLLGSTRVEVKV